MVIMSNTKNAHFYKYCRNYDYNKAIDTALKEDIISESDKNLILEYILERQALNNLSDIRCNKIASSLIGFRRFTPSDFISCSIVDIYSGITKMQTGLSQRGKPFKQNTKRDYITILKPFLLWLVDSEYVHLPVKKIKALKPLPPERSTIGPDEILTPDEILRLIQACKNSRDRALISVLYESGVRVAELGRLCWGDVIFDEFGVKLYIDDQKNRQHRYSRLVISTEYLATWKNDYPIDIAPEAPVFIDFMHRDAVHYDAIVRLLQRAQKRAGITKNTNPHIFRHTRITHMIQQNYQESIIKKSMWNNLNTEMFSVYVSLSESDIDNEFLQRAGIENIKPKEDHLMPVTCGNCQKVNPPGNAFCSNCGNPLHPGSEENTDHLYGEILRLVNDNPGFQDLLDEYNMILDKMLK